MSKKNFEEEENTMMEFVPKDDDIPEIGEEPKDEKPKPEEEPKKKRTNIFKRAWNGIKWVGRKVRNSPAATVIGGLAGSALTLGGVALVEHNKAKQKYATLEIEGDAPNPEEEEELIKMENELTEELNVDPLDEDNVVDEAV